MHEAAVAQVDADVVDALAATAEEHQVAGAQRAAVDLLAAVRHLSRDARQFDAQGTAEPIADQPAAVEIGRASCRARVCTKVWIWVVSVSFKNKTYNNHQLHATS